MQLIWIYYQQGVCACALMWIHIHMCKFVCTCTCVCVLLSLEAQVYQSQAPGSHCSYTELLTSLVVYVL